MSEYYAPRAIDNTLISVKELLAEKGFTNPVAVIDIFEQAKLAPDPQALPLSTAMRLARERTEAGTETWIATEHFLAYHTTVGRVRSIVLYRPSGQSWQRRAPGGRWAFAGGVMDCDAVEQAVCRLVSPEEGAALLRGEE